MGEILLLILAIVPFIMLCVLLYLLFDVTKHDSEPDGWCIRRVDPYEYRDATGNRVRKDQNASIPQKDSSY